jgi:uncharacterized protein (DUF1810 family)
MHPNATPTPADLSRFLEAQSKDNTFERALAELEAGNKTTHWMWFVFPQLRDLGRSSTAKFYGLADIAEARTYIAHPVLGARLRACTAALLTHEGRSATSILGTPDDIKLRSCLTLFIHATGETSGVFHDALARFYEGREDPDTLALSRDSAGNISSKMRRD